MAGSQIDCENVFTESSKQDGQQMDQAEAVGISAVEEVEDDDDNSFMCPVCSDGFVVPKLLPCGHVVCQLCMLHWLDAKGRKATCPFCRLKILIFDEPFNADEIDVYKEVCTLPTDFFTEAVAETHQLLQEPHICGLCDDVPAVSYCMQCCKKLCRKCVRSHKQIPATRKHPRVNLICLTAEKLVGTQPVMCETHPDRLAEVYCPEHKKVICRKCGSTSHQRCVDKNMVEDLERDTKVELQRQVESLKLKTTELAKKVKDVKLFKAHRSKIMEVLRSLPNMEYKQIRKFKSVPEVKDELFMTSLSALEKAQTILMQNDTTTSNLVQSTSGVALLKTLEPLKTHLDELERTAWESIAVLSDISFGEEELNRLKEAAALLDSTKVDASPAEAWIRLKVENIRISKRRRLFSRKYMIGNQPWEWFYIAQPDYYIRGPISGRHQVPVTQLHRFSERNRICGIELPWRTFSDHVFMDRIAVEVHIEVHPLNVEETGIPGVTLSAFFNGAPVCGTMTKYRFDESEELFSDSDSEEPDRENEFES